MAIAWRMTYNCDPEDDIARLDLENNVPELLDLIRKSKKRGLGFLELEAGFYEQFNIRLKDRHIYIRPKKGEITKLIFSKPKNRSDGKADNGEFVPFSIRTGELEGKTIVPCYDPMVQVVLPNEQFTYYFRIYFKSRPARGKVL